MCFHPKKVVCLFCLYWWDPLNRDASDCVLGILGKLSKKEGCIGLVSWCLDLQWRNSWVLMISSLKIKFNCSWNFSRNWNVPLMLLERSWWAAFNGIYLVRFGFRMWDILIFKWFLSLKIQIKFKKPGFGRKTQLRTWEHLGQRHRPHYLSMKKGSLFVLFVLMKSTESEYFRSHSWSLWKALQEDRAPLLIHKESGYEIFIYDTKGYESIVTMRNDVGTLQHFLLFVKFHQKDKLEIKNLEMQYFWRFWITKSVLFPPPLSFESPKVRGGK